MEEKKVAASAKDDPAEQAEQPELPEGDLVDLSKVTIKPKQLAGPKITVHKGTRGKSTVEGADMFKETAAKRNLESPLPASVAVAAVPGEPMAVLGIPTLNTSPSHIELKWDKHAELFRCNLNRLLTLKKIRIPSRTRLVINLEQVMHPKHGPCVKLWWNEDSFVPIADRPKSEKKEESESTERPTTK